MRTRLGSGRSLAAPAGVAAVLAAAGVAAWMLLGRSAAAEGKPDLKTYFAADFKDQPYQQKVHAAVGKAWRRSERAPSPGSKAVVVATILRDGSLLDARLHHKSGLEAWDASAMEAVKAAAPFGALPKSYSRTSVEVHFHFELN